MEFETFFYITALMTSIQEGYTEIGLELISHKSIDINMRDIKILSLFITFEVVLISLYLNFSFFMIFLIEKFNFTALMIAAQEGNIEITQELLSKKDIDINIQNISNQINSYD